MAELTFTEVCKWLRSQARNFDRMACEIESTFGSIAAHAPRSQTELTVEGVKQAIGDRSIRIVMLAKELEVGKSVLDRLVTEANGFVRGSRGWWSVRNGEIDNSDDEGGT